MIKLKKLIGQILYFFQINLNIDVVIFVDLKEVVKLKLY